MFCFVFYSPCVLQLGSVGHEPVIVPPRDWRRWNPEDGAAERDVASGDGFNNGDIVNSWRCVGVRGQGSILAKKAVDDVTASMRRGRGRFFDWKLRGWRGRGWERETKRVWGWGRGGGRDLGQTSQLVEVESCECAILLIRENSVYFSYKLKSKLYEMFQLPSVLAYKPTCV